MEDLRSSTVAVDDLFLCLRPVLIFGKMLGVTPLRSVYKTNKEKLPTSRSSTWTIISYMICASYTLRTITVCSLCVWFISQPSFGSFTPAERIQIIFGQTVTDALCSIVTCKFIWNTRKFCSLMKSWRDLCSRLSLVEHNAQLKTKIVVTFTAVMISAISENTLNTIKFLWTDGFSYLALIKWAFLENAIQSSFLEGYYHNHHKLFSQLIPYNPAIAGVVFFIHKMSFYTMNYVDIVIISLSFALAAKFTSLVSSIKKQPDLNWLLIRKDYLILFELLEHVEDLISFQIFCSMSFALYWICISIYTGLAYTSESLLDGIYGFWAFIHLAVRFFLICIPAGHIPESSHQIWEILQKCPQGKYNSEVMRMEHLISRPIGLTGLKYFTLSRSFILKVVSVIFTTEIVLLQVSGESQQA